jgi:hypothetical protein
MSAAVPCAGEKRGCDSGAAAVGGDGVHFDGVDFDEGDFDDNIMTPRGRSCSSNGLERDLERDFEESERRTSDRERHREELVLRSGPLAENDAVLGGEQLSQRRRRATLSTDGLREAPASDACPANPNIIFLALASSRNPFESVGEPAFTSSRCGSPLQLRSLTKCGDANDLRRRSGT